MYVCANVHMCTYQGDRIDNDNIYSPANKYTLKNTISFLKYTKKHNNYAIIFVISLQI